MSDWCRTTDVYMFNGKRLTEENAPKMCSCSDCGYYSQLNQRADGTYFLRRHKIKNKEQYA